MTAVPVKVTGFTDARSHYPWAVLWLAERVFADDVSPVHEPSLWDFDAAPSEPDLCEVQLVRPPAKERAHPHEIRVVVPALADGGFHPWVGFVEEPVAAVYADRLDRGMRPEAWVAAIPVKSPAEFSRPGMRVYVDWGDQ